MATTAESKRPTNVGRCYGLCLFVLLTLCGGSKAAAIGSEPEPAADASLHGQSRETVVHQEIPHQQQQQQDVQDRQLNQQQLSVEEHGIVGQQAQFDEELNVQAGSESVGVEQASSLEAGSNQASMDELQQQQQQQPNEDFQQGLGADEDHNQGQFHGGNVDEIIHGVGNVHDPSAHHRQVAENDDLTNQQVGVMDGEHLLHDAQHDVHQERSQEQPAEPEGHQRPIRGGDVEQMVHGGSNVHDPSGHHQAENNVDDHDSLLSGVADVEHLMHGGDNDVHAQSEHAAPVPTDETAKGEFKAVDVESLVHGEEAGEGGHVHGQDSSNSQHAQPGPYGVDVDIDTLGRDSVNVHDPRSRDLVASAGDLVGVGVGVEVMEEGEERKGKPTVADGESLMHGAGGHDHDAKQLKLLKTKEQIQAKDPFQDLHELLMHGHSTDVEDDSDEEGKERRDDDDHSLIRRGKKISYKDIVELGLDEASLRVVDLTKLLQENLREYDTWQRDTQAMAGEQPERSFWEQIGELRNRYLSFGRSDGKARDLTGTRLDPDKQRWVTTGDEEGEGERTGPDGDMGDKNEDSAMHRMELLGSTAAKKDRHKHHANGDDHGSGREQGDL